MRTTKVRWVHTYLDDATADLYGAGRCTACGLPAQNRIHAVAAVRPVSDEVSAFEARKLGEAQ